MINEETLKKWENDYIDEVDINNKSFLNLNASEMRNFINENYFDYSCGKYVTGRSYNMLLGLQYLDSQCALTHGENIRYLICIAPNKIGKCTILGDIIYHEDCLEVVDGQIVPVTLLEYSEANQYFRNKGINGSLLQEFSNIVNYDRMLLTTSLSVLGARYHVFTRLKSILEERGFNQDIRMLTQINEEYISVLLGKKKLELKKKDM